jgi:SLOG in TRPM, prokaryote
MSTEADNAPAPLVRVEDGDNLPAKLAQAGLTPGLTVVVIVGGVGGMDEQDLRSVADVLRDAVVPVVERHAAIVVDGGTDSGVMRLIGRARSAAGAGFPLVGVAAAGTVVVPGSDGPTLPDAAPLEPHHTLFFLVPGEEWGKEAPWISDIASLVAGSGPSVTVLINGGQIAYSDAEGSLAKGRPVVVLAGTGRTADAIAEALAGEGGDPRAAAIAASPLTSVVDIAAPDAVRAALEAALNGRSTGN